MTEENALLDDDNILFDGLSGRVWTDVSDELLEAEPDGYVLLHEEALPVYLAAWLISSLDNAKDKNQVREFLAYAFSVKGAQPNLHFKATLFRALTVEQRSVLRSLLAWIADVEPSEFIREYAASAVGFVDSLL